MNTFEYYDKRYKEFYEGVVELSRMENDFSNREPTLEESLEYNKLHDSLLSQCKEGTDIEDLIGLVVVAEKNKTLG